MLTVEEARAAVLDGIRPGTAGETVPLEQAHGRFLAAGACARVDNPAFDNSAMDGYALNSADLGSGPLPVKGEASCGDAPAALAPGTAMRIFTGAPLPAGADTVVMQEDVRLENGAAVFPANVKAGDNVRRRGEDFRAGEALYAAGRRLGACDLALLSAAGVAEVSVYRAARALVVATGNELVAPGEPLAPGRIYESNRLPTILQLRALGVEVVDGGVVRDDVQALRELLARAHDFDFVITSGGASVGDHDLVKQVFGELGAINFWRVRVKPGKPIAFGRVGSRTHFFALPGNPVSSLVTFRLFVEPAIHAWYRSVPATLELEALAANDFRRAPGRTEFLRARLYREDGRLLAEVLKGQGSHMLKPLSATNAFLRVEAESSGFARGETVRVLPFAGN
jgi:molybdopterin molybdotransferase